MFKMSLQLELATKEVFNNSEFEIYKGKDNEEWYMTSEQLGKVLEYSHPRQSINRIVNRNEYLESNEFTFEVQLTAQDGKMYLTRVLTEDGIYEITMLSKQPRAREFRSFIRKILKGLRTKEVKITQNFMANSVNQNDPLMATLAMQQQQLQAIMSMRNQQNELSAKQKELESIQEETTKQIENIDKTIEEELEFRRFRENLKGLDEVNILFKQLSRATGYTIPNLRTMLYEHIVSATGTNIYYLQKQKIKELQEQRIKEGKKPLKNPKYSLQQVVYDIGAEDIMFRKLYGALKKVNAVDSDLFNE